MNKTLHNLNYRVSGEGRPVVFLHGFLESISMWDFLKPFVNIQCVFVDLPGHGKSVLNEELELTMTSTAEAVIQITKELGIDSYDVIGHSMGGYVAVEMKRIDQSCDRVILLNSNFWEDSKTKKVDRRRVAELVQTKKEAFVKTAIPNLFMSPKNQPKEVEGLIIEASDISSDTISSSSIAMSLRLDNSRVIASYAHKVLIIQGEFDPIIPMEMMKEKIEDYDVELCIIPSGHMAHIEHTGLVKESITEFLA